MPTLVWLYLTALLYYRTSASCVALAESLETVRSWSRGALAPFLGPAVLDVLAVSVLGFLHDRPSCVI
jgi:hypothetical protein